MVIATEPTTIQSVVLKSGMLTDEAIRNGALKNIYEKRGNNREPSKDGNARDDNKRSRTRRAFSTTTNPARKEFLALGWHLEEIHVIWAHLEKKRTRLLKNTSNL
ncbi:hypothetical protein Tco_1042557 [Tanacetum coccineum]|uniref:Uncharacterized protein n=1 Tax=Tanacetum coccineum TaxID=301880 RepID=A0ABQ5GLR9_9ASTR